MGEDDTNDRLSDNEFMTLMMITRGTSPTTPASSSYLRNRRAEVGIIQQKEVTRPRKPPESTDKEIQCDRMEETSRISRYGGGNRVSGAAWSTYLDKYSSSSAAGSHVYSSRGFANTSSGGRLNSFAKTSDNSNVRGESTSKESSNPGQDTHNAGNRNQSEKVFGNGSSSTRTDDENSSAFNDSKTNPSSVQDIHDTNKDANEAKMQDAQEQCSCGARKIEPSGNPASSRTFNQDLAFHRGENSTTRDSREKNGSREERSNRQNPASRYDEYNPRRPSIPRLGHNSPKTEIKMLKNSSKTELTSSKPEAYERRGSTPKSDASLSSRGEKPFRIVEGHCQDQNEEVTSHKYDSSQRKDSTSRYANVFVIIKCMKDKYFFYIVLNCLFV